MGIRTKGFEKGSLKSGEKKTQQTVPSRPKDNSNKNSKPLEPSSPPPPPPPPPFEPKPQVADSSSPTTRSKSFKKVKIGTKLKSPIKMARLEGIKVAARKLKKHRKRNLLVSSATKILRTSIKTNKTRNVPRIEEKQLEARTGTMVPSRVSTRTLVRRTSREGIPEAPLRTVELIKRPLELREPATKLLYMASLGLYPKTGESDVSPIVIIRELCISPGKKNGVRKSMELPLIPQYHRRCTDLNQNKRNVVDMKLQGADKQRKRETSRRVSPTTIIESKEIIEQVGNNNKGEEQKFIPQNLSPPPPVTIVPSTSIQSCVTEVNNCTSMSTKKPPQLKAKRICINNNDFSLSPVTNTLKTYTTPVTSKVSCGPVVVESEKLVITKQKSLLRSHLMPTNHIKETPNEPFNFKTNLISNMAMRNPMSSEMFTAAANGITNAMNLVMSNITIIPKPSTSASSRKRPISPTLLDLQSVESIRIPRAIEFNNQGIGVTTKQPRKRQKIANITNLSSEEVIVPQALANIGSYYNPQNVFLQQTPPQAVEEALNLSVKNKAFDIPLPNVQKSPPKLQRNSKQFTEHQKPLINGPKPLNLIIPRPPPLTKAPLEAADLGNCSQNLQPVVPVKHKSKVSRKQRQIIQQQDLLLQPILLPPETTLQAKSLLKCMNGEENVCVREVGESLDSVKTMLSRLQTRIGPAVNGVRLITIE